MRRALLIVLIACGHHASAPVPPPAPADAAVAGCSADADHCCMPDGRVVVPGGCSPVVRAGTEANVERQDDGTCKPVPCQLRCLPEDAQIATPSGDVAVSQLHAGDTVWTADADGKKVAQPVLIVRALPRTQTHLLVELTLSDGRVVRASAGHPSAEGEAVVDLAVGDALDGATIDRVRYVPYDGAATWDLLPAGATGTYWANGVHLGSTMQQVQSPPKTIPAAAIAISKAANGGTLVLLNVGARDGVLTGYHAQLLDAKGHPLKDGTFLITQVRKNTCSGVVMLPMKTVEHAADHLLVGP